MEESRTFQLRKTILLATAIVYGCKIVRSDSRRINASLLRSSFNDVMKIVKLIVKK